MLIEKDQLLPFEEAKLFGHNAIHALMAYLAAFKGYSKMSRLRDDSQIMQIARDAFINESGAALRKKYSSIDDELFTEDGFRHYAEDLLERMTNPYLEDTVERAGRDPIRKLGVNDRIFGAMALCLDQGIKPQNIALGAMAGIVYLFGKSEICKIPERLICHEWQLMSDTEIKATLEWLWGSDNDIQLFQKLLECVQQARNKLVDLIP